MTEEPYGTPEKNALYERTLEIKDACLKIVATRSLDDLSSLTRELLDVELNHLWKEETRIKKILDPFLYY